LIWHWGEFLDANAKLQGSIFRVIDRIIHDCAFVYLMAFALFIDA
jgi:hypothetical protein